MGTWISFASFSDELTKIAERDLKPANKKIPIAKADAKIYAKLKKGSPVKIHIHDDAKAFGGGFFDMDTNEITLSEKNFKVLAHELGHAHLHESILGRLLQGKMSRTAHSLSGSIFSSLGVGLLVAKGKPWGLLLPAAAATPTFISELLATHKGGKLLDEAGVTSAQKEDYKKTTRAGAASYLIAPAVGTLGGIVSSHAMKS